MAVSCRDDRTLLEPSAHRRAVATTQATVLGILFLAHLLAFLDAPFRLWRAWTTAKNVHRFSYYGANAYVLGVVGLAAWLRWRAEMDVALSGFLPMTWDLVAWVGVGVGAAGLLLAVAARVALGAWFAPTGAVFKGQHVVVHGPYAWVRHPLYVGWWMFLAGAGLAFDSGAIAAATLLVIPGLGAIGRGEERLLRDELGDEYDAYRDRVPRWVPRPPRGESKH